MRIALISHAADANAVGGSGLAPGIQVHARALAELGHSVQVFAAGQPPIGLKGAGLGSDQGRSTQIEIDGIVCSFFARDGALRRALIGNADFGLHRVAEALADASDALAALRRELRGGAFDVVEVVGDGAAAGLVALCDGIPALVRTTGIWPHDGSTAERFAAGRLAKLGLRAARAISVPSAWLRNRLSRGKILQGPAVVVPDGFEPSLASVTNEPGSSSLRLFFWCDSRDCDGGEIVAFLDATLAAHPQLNIQVAGPKSRAAPLEALQERFRAAGPRFSVLPPSVAGALPATPASAIGLFWCEHAPTCPPPLVQAMAAAMPLLARGIESVPEAVRHDLDGLLFDSVTSAGHQLHRLLSNHSLRERLAKTAKARAMSRFDPIACARRRVQLYEFAAGQRLSRPTARPPATPEAVLELAPHNWFEAWWIAGTERVATRLARDDQGRSLLLQLSGEELMIVRAVLLRTWCEGPRDWGSREWAELREFDAQVLDRLDELRRTDHSASNKPAMQLVYPPPEHPMFGPDESPVLLEEAWRVDRQKGFVAWLSTTVQRRDFVTLATASVHLRRIAVEAALQAPGVAVFEVLRRIYRDAKRHPHVVEGDNAFIARGIAKDGLVRGIAELGLHAPLTRPRFAPARRTRRKTPVAVGTGKPRITVLIPSYRHENYIALAIESCLRQSIHDLRVLVVDDQSPDGTVAAARSTADPRLRVEVNATNLGLGASVLAALPLIDTEYVALLNSDDLFHPDRLARCLAAFEDDAEASLVATKFAVVDRRGDLLTHTTSSAVEIGPAAHGWLRWFEGIARDELQRIEDWSSFEVLLRHNVLATSSNMVFRTEWLRTHMPEASRLKYCLDWQLFLQAAMEGSLRMIDAELLAYRLHETNTVWFREGGRADYVFEVNRVVDRVLGHWMQRTVERDGPDAAVGRLAHLLEHDVRWHGEVDGLALYLSDLAQRHAANRVDARAAPLEALAEAALRRNRYGQALRHLDVDPWSLPWRLQLADGWRIEHDVANGYGARVRDLDSETARLRIEIGSHENEAADLRAKRERAEANLAAKDRENSEERQRHETLTAAALAHHQAELAAARREIDEERKRLAETAAAAEARAQRDFAAALERYRVSLQREAAAAQELTTRIRALDADLAHRSQVITTLETEARRQVANIEQLETRTRDLTRQLDERNSAASQLEAALEQARQTNDGLRAAVAELTTERNSQGERLVELESLRDALQSELTALRSELQRRHADLQDRETRLAQAEKERSEALADARREARLGNRAIASAIAHQAAFDARGNSPSWRLGNSLMRRVGVLQAYKTLAAWLRRGQAITQRGISHLGRWSTAEGRNRTGVVLFVDAPHGQSPDCYLHLASRIAGGTTRLIGWSADFADGARRDVERALPERGSRWLPDDPRIDASDRSYFVKRNPAAVDEIERRFGSDLWTGRAWRAARVAKSLGVGVAIARGLGGGAIEAYAAQRLCGIRYALVLADEDLLDHRLGGEAAIVLRSASLLIVDSDRLLAAAEQLIGEPHACCVVRWACHPEPISVTRPSSTSVRAFVHWTAWRRADPATLVEAVRHAVAAGCDITIDVVGDLGDGPSGLRRWLLLQDQIESSGQAARFHLHGHLAPAARRRLLDEADLVLWVGRSLAGAGLPAPVVEAFATGKPVIASAVPELTWLPALSQNLELIAPGMPNALSATLTRFAEDRSLAIRRLEAGRKLMAQCAAIDAGRPILPLLTAGETR